MSPSDNFLGVVLASGVRRSGVRTTKYKFNSKVGMVLVCTVFCCKDVSRPGPYT